MTWYDFPLDESVSSLFLQPSGLRGLATVQYITYVPTEFGVNAHGQSFGISGDPRGEPDLVAVVATNGEQGYVFRTDLEDANGTTAAESFESPEDALAWQEENAGVMHRVPVYESDGATQIGEFQVRG